MRRDPSFFLSNIKQNAVDTFFGAGTWIKIVGEKFMDISAAIVNHQLLSFKMRHPKGRRHIDDRLGMKPVMNFIGTQGTLQVAQSKSKKGGVDRSHHQRVHSHVPLSSNEGNHY